MDAPKTRNRPKSIAHDTSSPDHNFRAFLVSPKKDERRVTRVRPTFLCRLFASFAPFPFSLCLTIAVLSLPGCLMLNVDDDDDDDDDDDNDGSGKDNDANGERPDRLGPIDRFLEKTLTNSCLKINAGSILTVLSAATANF